MSQYWLVEPWKSNLDQRATVIIGNKFGIWLVKMTVISKWVSISLAKPMGHLGIDLGMLNACMMVQEQILLVFLDQLP